MPQQLDERGDPVSKTHHPDRTRYSATEARQGFLGKPVLKVLGISLALAFAVWGAVEIWGGNIDPDESVDDAQTSSTTTETTPGADDGTGFDDDPPAGTAQETAPTDEDPTAQSGTGGESQTTTDDGSVN